MLNNIFKRLPIIIWLLLALFAVRAFTYATFTPVWQGPDEPGHYEYVHFLQTERRFPVLGEATSCRKVRHSLNSFHFNEYTSGRNPYAGKSNLDTKEMTFGKIEHQDEKPARKGSAKRLQRNQIVQHPPLYYLIGALFTWPFKYGSLLNSIIILRMLSAMFGIGVVLLTYLTISLIFDKRSFAAYAATAFVALNPMFTHVTTLVNNDSLANFLFALFLYLLIKSVKIGLDGKRALGIGIVIAAGLLTKFFFVLALPLIILASVFFRREMLGEYKIAFLNVSVPIILAGFYYVRNVVLYGAIQPIYTFRHFDTSKFEQMSFVDFLTGTYFIKKLIISFWSNFGWILPRYPMFYYRTLTLFALISIAGLVVYLIKTGIKRDFVKVKVVALLTFIPASLMIAMAINSYRLAKVSGVVEGVQGRYLFSTIGIIGMVLYLGIKQILPFRKGYFAFVFIVSVMVFLDISAIFYHILPYFYF